LIWQFEGDDERAILDFNEAIRIRPNHSTYESRGSFWLDKRELDRAISDLTIALDFLNSSCSRCPEIVSTYTFRAEAFSLRGEFEQALADYSAAIDIAPGAAFIFRDRGGIRAQQRNFGDAVLDFNRAIELGLNSWHTYYLRALAREQILDLDVAMLDMRTAQRLGTTSIPAQYQTEIMEFFIRVTRTQARQESLRNSPPLNQNPPQSFLQHPEGSHVEHTSDLNSRSDEYFNAASRALERALVDLRQGLERIDRIQR
jgi:tetratricopeptide (TPR) repeat protein